MPAPDPDPIDLALSLALTQAPDDARSAPTAEQARFNALIGRLARARQTLADWDRHGPLFAQAHAALPAPPLDDLFAVRRSWLLALDAVSSRKGWTRNERDTLRTLILETADALLSRGPCDAVLDALYARHAGLDLAQEAERVELLRRLKAAAEAELAAGVGEDGVIDDEVLRHRIADMLQAREEADAAAAPPPPRTASERERDAQARLARLSARDVFRQLASALHPDREADEARRSAKTALMKRVNRAHDENDLLALLELQAQTAPLGTQQVARGDPQQVQRFNQALAEQLDRLREEIRNVELDFRLDFNLGFRARLDPLALDTHLVRESTQVDFELQQMRDEIVLLGNVAATRRWLHEMRWQVMRPFDGEPQG